MSDLRLAEAAEGELENCAIYLSAVAAVPENVLALASEATRSAVENGFPVPTAKVFLNSEWALNPDSEEVHLLARACYRHEPERIVPLVVETAGTVEIIVFAVDDFQPREAMCVASDHEVIVSLSERLGDRDLIGASRLELNDERQPWHRLASPPATAPIPADGLGSATTATSTTRLLMTTQQATTTIRARRGADRHPE
ncbi:MAG: hypothetical protein GY720_01455 [bacterium]|nr:hypothetical protein [bacterium]